MRAWAALLMAVCLAGAAAAQFAPPTCGAPGVAGGWSPMSPEEIDMVASAVVTEFMDEFSANVTDAIALPVIPEDYNITAKGCKQVVAGMNYKLWANVTATVEGQEVVVGLDAEVYQPLPVNGTEQPLEISNLDLDFATLDGAVKYQDNAAEDNDRWQVVNGTFVENADFDKEALEDPESWLYEVEDDLFELTGKGDVVTGDTGATGTNTGATDTDTGADDGATDDGPTDDGPLDESQDDADLRRRRA